MRYRRRCRTDWDLVWLVLLVLLVGAMGCSEERKISQKAEWLCAQNQLESPSRTVFEDEDVLEAYIHPLDLRRIDQVENAELGGLFGELEDWLIKVEGAGHRSLVRYTDCEVENVDIDGDRATVTVTRTIPVIDPGFDEVLELEDLDEDEIEAEFVGWYSESDKKETTKHTVEFAKTEDGWRAYLGLERVERESELEDLREKVAAIDEEIAEVQEELAEIEEARQRLADFEVVNAELTQRQRRYMGPENSMRIEVRNNTEHPVSRVYFDATYQSPDRSVPWAADSMNYSISGGLEPEESADWRLQPNIMSDLRDVSVHDDAELHLTVYRLDGPDGEALWSVPSEHRDSMYAMFDDAPPEERLESLKEERGELETEIEELEETIDGMGL